MKTAWILAGALWFSAAAASAEVDEIIVTAQRYSDAYENLVVPHVTTTRRADFAIFDLTVRDDTRDFSQRQDEMRAALKGLQARAKEGVVTLALADEDSGIVRDFSLAAAEELMSGAGRPDTSALTIQVRTPVSAKDTLESVQARIDDFVDAAPKPGRIEMVTGDMALTLVDPGQYRDPLVERIVADWRGISAKIGPGYGAQITGLERPVAWRRSGDLDLTLFVPYGLSVLPAAQ